MGTIVELSHTYQAAVPQDFFFWAPPQSDTGTDYKISITTTPVTGHASEWERHLRARLHDLEKLHQKNTDANFSEMFSTLLLYLKETLPPLTILPRVFFREVGTPGFATSTVECFWQVEDETVQLNVLPDNTLTLSYRCGDDGEDDTIRILGDATTEEHKEFFSTQIFDMTARTLNLFT